MRVEVAKLAGGGLAERLNQEMERAVANICDPNTEARKKRTITMKITLSPNNDRTSCGVDIDCNSKLAPAAPLVTAIMVGLDPRTGEIDAVEPQQGNLFPSTSVLPENVVDITNRQKSAEA